MFFTFNVPKTLATATNRAKKKMLIFKEGKRPFLGDSLGETQCVYFYLPK